MWFVKNNKGQALIEAVIIIQILLMLFFTMLFFSIYIYNKMVVMFASNIALDEAIGLLPHKQTPEGRIELLMRNKAKQAVSKGMFLSDPKVYAKAQRKPKDTGTAIAIVSATFTLKLPFVSNVVNNSLKHTSEVNYAW